MHARNTLEQLLAAYTNPESHNAQRHRQTDRQTDRRTDGRTYGQQAAANSRSYCVAVRSAKITRFCGLCSKTYSIVLHSIVEGLAVKWIFFVPLGQFTS